jgi:penicillin-binding protein 1C
MPRLNGATKVLSYLLLPALSLLILFAALNAIFPLPPLKPYSLQVEDRNGHLLQAFLADDGIWRMRTTSQEIPTRLREILIQKEDRFFHYHPGVNPFSVVRAMAQNLLAGRRVSGASTLTMQVARMLERKDRTYANKLVEMFRALQLEWRYTKDEILNLYLSIVPLGGNIEGLKSASLLYYQTPIERLNIAQLFDLILIPNDPNGLRPDRNGKALYRARLAAAMPWIQGHFFTREDSIVILQTDAESKRKQLPAIAPHFCLRIKEQFPEEPTVRSSLDIRIQQMAEQLLQNHLQPWKLRDVNNGAVLVIDNRTREILAYVGSERFADSAAQGQVDAVRALRSPGSTMKPFLYAMEMENGRLTPKTRLLDVPYDADGFVVENFDRMFSGWVYADEALRRSLNTPMIRMLRVAGVRKFIDFMNTVGFASLQQQRERVGLSVVVGGCGITLEEITNAFATFPSQGLYMKPSFVAAKGSLAVMPTRAFSPSTAFMVTEILSGIDRPDLPNNFESAMNLSRVAFKTGTSYGKRDAWCVGYTAEYTVGVWIGNVSNKGSPELVGSKSATPLLIDILNSISSTNQTTIVPTPQDIQVRFVCANSGLLPTQQCDHQIVDFYSVRQSLNRLCTVDREFLLSPDGKRSYCQSCLGEDKYIVKNFQDYPPELLSYWKRLGRKYNAVPPHNPACERVFAGEGPKILTPSSDMTYFMVSQDQKIPLQASSSGDVHEHLWYLDEQYLGRKKAGEKLFLAIREGKHTITCLDDKGRLSIVAFTVRFVI